MRTIEEIIRQMLEKEWKGKQVWELISSGEMTAALGFKGSQYDNASVKIMYVGHAFNGWEALDLAQCTSLVETANAICGQNDVEALDTLVNVDGYPYIDSRGKNRVYKHITSKFFRLIKQVLELQGESDFPTTDITWYHDSKNWNQKIVWSNLFNIAPRKQGNPSNDFIKVLLDDYIDLFEAQVEMYSPDVIIFCPLRGYLDPWKRKPSFMKVLDQFELNNEDCAILGTGSHKGAEVMLIKRPDKRGTSYEDVYEMAKCISQYIDKRIGVRRQNN